MSEFDIKVIITLMLMAISVAGFLVKFYKDLKKLEIRVTTDLELLKAEQVRQSLELIELRRKLNIKEERTSQKFDSLRTEIAQSNLIVQDKFETIAGTLGELKALVIKNT